MKTKEISKYRVSTALEKSISKKHSLSLSLRKAVLEKLEKQKELLALREAAEKKKKSEGANLLDVQEVGASSKGGPSKVSNGNPTKKDEQQDSKIHTDNHQSDLVEVIDKPTEAQSDLKSLIKTLVTKKTPDSETIKKIVSKTRLDLKNREEAKEIGKKKVEMAKEEEKSKVEMTNREKKSKSKEAEVKKCRYCKDNNGWGEVILI